MALSSHGLSEGEEFSNTSEMMEVAIGTNALPIDSHTDTELCGNEALTCREILGNLVNMRLPPSKIT